MNLLQIYDLPISRTQGLARLLVLEKNATSYAGGLGAPHHIQYKLPTSNYDIAELRIPYGPRWNAEGIARLVRHVDRRMNCKYPDIVYYTMAYILLKLLVTSQTTWASIVTQLSLVASKNVF